MEGRPRMRRAREFDLIAKLAERAARPGAGAASPSRVGVGDDAAVGVPGGATATSVDMLVEGVHFRRDTAPPAAVGRKALAAALSDLAAMGAAPGEAYVALGIPPDLGEDECLELYAGIAEVAAAAGVAVEGGDLSESPVLVLAVTVVGHAAAPERLVRRAGARPGHAIAVTGKLGGAAAGLVLLERPELARDLDAELAEGLRRRQLEPPLRLAAGVALAGAGVAAMIDVSDGVGADAAQLAAAGGVAVAIDLDALPLQAGVSELAAAADLDPLELASSGGEDYELLVALDPGRVADARAAADGTGVTLTVIGEAGKGEGAELRGPDGRVRPAGGFEHLGGR